jgi:hypothetical protein
LTSFICCWGGQDFVSEILPSQTVLVTLLFLAANLAIFQLANAAIFRI